MKILIIELNIIIFLLLISYDNIGSDYKSDLINKI